VALRLPLAMSVTVMVVPLRVVGVTRVTEKVWIPASALLNL
jgi:hypothetical protein